MKCSIQNGSRSGRAPAFKSQRFSLLLVWLTILWMMVQVQAKAQNCQRPLSHGATWYGVCDNAIYQSGDPVFLCWGWNGSNDIKKIKVEIIQLSGFEDNLNCDVKDAIVYSKQAECDNYQSGRQICEDIMLCPRTGSFKLVITVGLKGSLFKKCPKEDLTTTILFSILPALDIPVPTSNAITLSCPNKATDIEVDKTLSNQNGVEWFKDPFCISGNSSSNSPERTGYIYQVTLPPRGTWIGYPCYYKESKRTYATFRNDQPTEYQEKTCKIHGLRVPYTAIGASLQTAITPQPIYRVTCDDEPENFQISNPLGEYDGVYWYDVPSGGMPIHDGFTYSRPFPDNYTVLYIAYYKRLAEECEDISLVKAPVVVVNLKSIYNQANKALSARPLSKTLKITDYRDVGGLHCNEPTGEDQYWVDLENVQMNDQIATVEEAFIAAVDALNLIGGPVQFHAEVSDSYWQAYNSSSGAYETSGIYFKQGSQSIVCSDFICQQGSVATRLYEKMGKISFSYNFTNPITGEVTRESDLACGVRKLAVLQIQSIHPQEDEKDKCKPLTLESLQKYSVSVANLVVGCDNLELISACPDQNYEIGPDEAEINAMFIAKGGVPNPIPGFKPYTSSVWDPVGGLSASNEINPTISFSGIVDPANGGKFSKYTCKINFVNFKTANHCTIFYKCDACGPQPKKPILEEILQSN